MVVVSEGVIAINHVKVAPVGDWFRIDISFFDERVHLTDTDTSTNDVRFAQQFVDEPPRRVLGDTGFSARSRKHVHTSG